MKKERNITFLSSASDFSVLEHLNILCQILEVVSSELNGFEWTEAT